jgi:hypothetical protein
VGTGTDAFFTELNRGRPDASAIDFACYSINPQVHAFDNLSLMENLQGQAATVATARTFLAGKPVAVTPVTLRPRTSPAPADPRQASLFGAAWTLGSLAYLAESGVASVTYYRTHGAEGVMNEDAVFPLYHAFAGLAGFVGARVHRVDTSDPLRACAMAIESRGRRRVLIANLTAEADTVALDAAWLGRRALRSTLSEHNYTEATQSPEKFLAARGSLIEAIDGRYRIAMPAYSIARLDAGRLAR